MTAAGESSFPPAALQWLIDAPGRRVLALGRTAAPLMSFLADSGNALSASDPEPSGVRRLLAHAPRALPTVSEPTQLPFASGTFDAIVINQSLHTLPLEQVLPEFARVLAPQGHLAISYTVRDDSVPWVRRLVRLMRTVDPQAMTGDYGTGSLAEVEASEHFPWLDAREFRLWTPVSRADMLDMVRRRFLRLETDRLESLLSAVGELFDSSARAHQPLKLPYRVSCWRATVEHGTLAPQPDVDGGLTITL